MIPGRRGEVLSEKEQEHLSSQAISSMKGFRDMRKHQNRLAGKGQVACTVCDKIADKLGVE